MKHNHNENEKAALPIFLQSYNPDMHTDSSLCLRIAAAQSFGRFEPKTHT